MEKMIPSGPVDRTLVNDLALVAVSGSALAVVLALVFAGTGSATVAASSDRPAVGEVKRQMNRVRRRVKGDLVWNPIGRGAPIYGEDAVYVGPDSEATIELDDGSRIEIDESSMVVISRQIGARDVEEATVAVNIIRGGTTGRSGRRGLALHAGESTARLGTGSEANVRVRGDRTASVAVLSGTARVEAETKDTVTVREGERRRLDDKGHSVGEVEMATIELVSPARGARVYLTPARREVSFAWRPQKGPGRYVLEIAGDPDFEKLAARVRTNLSRVEARLPAQGVFYWRVMRPQKGATTRASEERRLTAVEDVAPLPYRPVADGVVDLSDGRPLSFAWSAVPDVARYILEVAQGESFKTPLYSVPVDRPFHIVRPSESEVREGRHCFRVRSDAPGRGTSPWSETTCFRIITRPVLRAPKLFPSTTNGIGDGEEDDSGGQRGGLFWQLVLPSAHAAPSSIPPVRLRWERLSGAAAYLVEIATDRAFTDIVVRQRVPTNTFRWQPPARRPYFWRVRGVDAEGRQGRVSETQAVEIDLAGPIVAKPANGARFQHTSRPPRIRFEWAPVGSAVGYTVEVGRDAVFAGAVDRLDARTTSVAYVPPGLGAFFWRVIGLLEGGTKTLPGPSSSFVVVPAPPEPLEPENGARVSMAGPETNVELRWTRRPVRRFELVVAADRAFTDIVGRSVSTESTAGIAVGGPGELFWRVRAVEPGTRWSDPCRLTVVPATPALTNPDDGATLVREADSPSVELSWAPAAGARSYRMTLKRPAAGEGEPESISLQGTTTVLELRTPGLYTWSVSAVFDESLVSDASAPRSFALRLNAVEPQDAGECVDGGCVEGKCSDGGCIEVQERGDTALPVDRHLKVHVGPRLGLFYNFGEIVAPRYGVEAGTRVLVAGHRLGLSLTAAYFTYATAFSDRNIQVESRLHGLPVELVAVYVLPMGWLNLTYGAGLAVTATHTTISIAGQLGRSPTHVAIGGVVAAGLEWPLGPGSLFTEVLFGFGSRSTGVVETAPGLLGQDIGYRIEVW